MIYLIQDCYEDSEGNYHKVLKIGYSKKPFGESRESHYKTHNYGFKLLGEREGSQDLEHYLQNLFQDLRLDREWFKYSKDIIEKFQKVGEEEITPLVAQGGLNERIRYVILKELISTPKRLKKLYLDKILLELKNLSEKLDDIVYEEYLFKMEILRVFKFVCSKEKQFFENLDFSASDIQENVKKCFSDYQELAKVQKDKWSFFKEKVLDFYNETKTIFLGDKFDFFELLEQKRTSTNSLLSIFDKGTPKEKKLVLEKFIKSIKMSRCSDDFITISKKTNLPVYNILLDLANEKASEICKRDYLEKTVLTKNQPEDIKKDLENSTEETTLSEAILNKFKPGDRYSKKELKSILGNLYRDLGITKTPKATDLADYFELVRTCIIDPVTKKKQEGYRLEEKGA